MKKASPLPFGTEVMGAFDGPALEAAETSAGSPIEDKPPDRSPSSTTSTPGGKCF